MKSSADHQQCKCLTCDLSGKKNCRCDCVKYQLSEVLDHAGDLCYRRDLIKGKYDYISSSAQSLTGYTVEELKQISFDEIWMFQHPDDRKSSMEEFKKASVYSPDNFGPRIIKYRGKTKSGEYKWCKEKYSIIFDNAHKPHYMVGTVTDISEHEEFNSMRSENLQNYKMLYDEALVAMGRTSLETGKVIECNLKMAKLLGYESVEEVKEKCDITKHYVDPGFRDKMVANLKKQRQLSDLEFEIVVADGSRKWLRASAQLYPSQGYIEVAAFDVTLTKILTKTEIQIFYTVLEGLSNNEIAKRFHKSRRTIEDHRAHLMKKLNVTCQLSLVKKAVEMGLLHLMMLCCQMV